MGKGHVSNYQETLRRKEERKAEKKARKARQEKILQKFENSMGAQELRDLQGMGWEEKAKFVLASSWILNKWYEKLGLLIFLFLGCWKILNLFGLF